MTKYVHGGGTRLPIEPLRGWLIEQLRAEGLWNEATGRCYSSRELAVIRSRSEMGWATGRCVADVAAHLDLLPRRLYSLLHESEFVYLDVADRVFCRFGDPNLLRGFYPGLYDLPPLEDDEPVALRPSRRRLGPLPLAKVCPDCGEERPIGEFPLYNGNPRLRCRPHHNAAIKRRRAAIRARAIAA